MWPVQDREKIHLKKKENKVKKYILVNSSGETQRNNRKQTDKYS